MNTAEIKLHLFREIDGLSPVYLMELQQMVNSFVSKKRPRKKKKRTFGSMKGLVIYMAPDFNAPLDDFKDYM